MGGEGEVYILYSARSVYCVRVLQRKAAWVYSLYYIYHIKTLPYTKRRQLNLLAHGLPTAH